jgi:hypothetical protein
MRSGKDKNNPPDNLKRTSWNISSNISNAGVRLAGFTSPFKA